MSASFDPANLTAREQIIPSSLLEHASGLIGHFFVGLTALGVAGLLLGHVETWMKGQ